MTCETCRILLAEALDLALRAKKLDAAMAEACSRRCGTPALWVMEQYDRDLGAWESRSIRHLQQGCSA